ncbi:hypothetical protein CW306_00545 [Bacillus sp. BA3]|uniref:hypothetical protein n=1 Tax=Bacillus sp. BA3 TaxID=2057910 RepID=UPI000C332D00|nr:hypothetical protein [Bacillus sp. BA3]PKF90061.1 hypothetical protein CW306_00545 [Bacillus sp. BA3]
MLELNKWVKEVVTVLPNLGGNATLEEIYSEVEKRNEIDLSSYTDWKAQIRKNIYLHSSDCEIFPGKPGDEKDLFYSLEGKGQGKWAMRIHNSQQIIYPFIINHHYKRSEIHNALGGNRQRGISVSKKQSMIFIFSGKAGEDYGYKDSWQDETTFFYSGEGQTGDQQFKEGNKALRDHVANGKDVHLFEKNIKTGLYKFKGQLTCIGYHTISGSEKMVSNERL